MNLGTGFPDSAGHDPAVQIRVVGPEWQGPTPGDLRRLFRGRRLTAARRERLALSGRVVAQTNGRIVGLAAYDRIGSELRVHEFGIDEAAKCPADAVAATLLEALEVACLAGGGHRLVLLPRATLSEDLLRVRGYATISHGLSGSWYEKVFAS